MWKAENEELRQCENEEMRERQSCFKIAHAVVPCVTAERSETAECREDADGTVGVRVSRS